MLGRWWWWGEGGWQAKIRVQIEGRVRVSIKTRLEGFYWILNG